MMKCSHIRGTWDPRFLQRTTVSGHIDLCLLWGTCCLSRKRGGISSTIKIILSSPLPWLLITSLSSLLNEYILQGLVITKKKKKKPSTCSYWIYTWIARKSGYKRHKTNLIPGRKAASTEVKEESSEIVLIILFSERDRSCELKEDFKKNRKNVLENSYYLFSRQSDKDSAGQVGAQSR